MFYKKYKLNENEKHLQVLLTRLELNHLKVAKNLLESKKDEILKILENNLHKKYTKRVQNKLQSEVHADLYVYKSDYACDLMLSFINDRMVSVKTDEKTIVAYSNTSKIYLLGYKEDENYSIEDYKKQLSDRIEQLYNDIVATENFLNNLELFEKMYNDIINKISDYEKVVSPYHLADRFKITIG